MSIDLALQRRVVSSGKFGSLIENSSCQTSFLGNGNTHLSIQLIAKLAKKYQKQSERWAKELQKNSQSQTIKANYDFLYNHFQYKADGIQQNIYSPKCAWHKRYEGIDCKSYTLIASSLLLIQGYNHFLRKITQLGDAPGDFSHVYVVIPKDQNTNDLKKGYDVIDATTHNNIEPHFIQKHDVFMEAMPHIGLNGTRFNCSPRYAKKVVKASNAGKKLRIGKSVGGRNLAKWRWGLLGSPMPKAAQSLLNIKQNIIQAGFSESTFQQMLDYVLEITSVGFPSSQIVFTPTLEGFRISDTFGKGLTFKHPNPQSGKWLEKVLLQNNSRLRGLRSSEGSSEGSWTDNLLDDIDWDEVLGSIGSLFSGGWYDKNEVEADAETIVNYFSGLINGINQNVNNPILLGEKVAEFKAMSELLRKIAACAETRCYENGSWSSATKKGMKTIKTLVTRIKINGGGLIYSWLSSYFEKGSQVQSYELNANQFYKPGGSIFKLIQNPNGTGKGMTYTQQATVFSYMPKANVQIKQLEFVPELIENDSVSGTSILNSLQNILVSTGAIPSNNSGNTTSGGGASTDANWQGQDPSVLNTNKTSNASLWILGAIGAGLLFKNQLSNQIKPAK